MAEQLTDEQRQWMQDHMDKHDPEDADEVANECKEE